MLKILTTLLKTKHPLSWQLDILNGHFLVGELHLDLNEKKNMEIQIKKKKEKKGRLAFLKIKIKIKM